LAAAIAIIAGVLVLCWGLHSIAGRTPARVEPGTPIEPPVQSPTEPPDRPVDGTPVEPVGKPAGETLVPMLAIILDDWGYGVAGTKEGLDLPIPLTMAVLPNGPHSRREADEGRGRGHEVILHLPMEALSTDHGVAAPEGTITVDMDTDKIKRLVEEYIEAVGPVSGLNNHTGSKATADRRVAGAVAEVAAEKGLFVIDSRTIGNSVLAAVAASAGAPSAKNEVFLDNQRDEEYVKSRLRLAATLARKRGAIISIGHVDPVTVKAILEMIPEIEEMGVTLVKASRVVEALNVPVMNLADPRLK